MESPVDHVTGGIRSLLVELRAHGEAIGHDLLNRGWTRSDLGRRVSWQEFYHWLRWMPPTADSAYYRAQKPNSWWVTPELQLLAAVLYAVEAANWQRGRCKGPAPKPIKFPQDRKISVKDGDDLSARRQRIADQRRR